MAQAIKEHCNEHTQKQLAFNCLGVSLKYLSPAANSLEIRIAGGQPKYLSLKYLSPAANSLEIRIAGRQVPKPRCLSPAANSLEIRIAGRQVQCTAPEHAYAARAMPLARL